ncbi:conjugative transposon protein TraN [Elizabethkingia anophelis]|nr:conjugative transposon protein TraN [Elizabethkingia anophelis]MCT3994424.1 conjugative transposon protein TraN [Elizabethkingia anophelis]MCT3997914.1 conjugative transposon protein TraN [Elizabethkingia anophelis]MCT4254959.1 conjugative transposon protein TraN [Elizabethkingia anophelis]
MKTVLKILILTLVFFSKNARLYAQEAATERLGFASVEPYNMEVTYHKTTHLLFPHAIRYVDLGSDLLIAGKAEDAENVLRVKAAVRDFEEQTNFSVITDDGRFYNFNVHYSSYPDILNYDLLTMQRSEDQRNPDNVYFQDMGDSSPSLVGLLMETIYKANKRVLKHIASRSYGILYQLKGLYIHDGKYYFHTELSNKSNVPYQIDYITFKIVDKKIAKRTVVQEKQLKTLRTYRPLETLAGQTTEQNVFLLDQFTIASDQVLLIDVYESNGGRHQQLQLGNEDLIKAKVINQMHLKIR